MASKYYVIFGIDRDDVAMQWSDDACLHLTGYDRVGRWDFDNLVDALKKAIETEGEVRDRQHRKVWSAK